MVDKIKIVGVIGAGQMGAGIAQVAAANGFEVVVRDISREFLDKGVKQVTSGLGRLVKKEKITPEQRDEILGRITWTENLEEMASADLLVEAATENLELKKKIFQELDRVAKPGAILGTNTSSISITRLASVTSRPEKVAGIHYMNPVPVMRLVEVIRGQLTSDETYQQVVEASEAMGKTVVTAAKDMPGFIVNRILMPMINEAVFTLHEGIGTAEDIDNAMKLGTNQPMGPLALADLIGLDTCLSIMEVLHSGLGDSKYRPCPLLRTYVDAGLLGRKSGRGFYSY